MNKRKQTQTPTLDFTAMNKNAFPNELVLLASKRNRVEGEGHCSMQSFWDLHLRGSAVSYTRIPTALYTDYTWQGLWQGKAKRAGRIWSRVFISIISDSFLKQHDALRKGSKTQADCWPAGSTSPQSQDTAHSVSI